MIASKQHDKIAYVVVRARARGDDVDDSHIWVGRVTLIDPHRRWMAVKQFRVPIVYNIEDLDLLMDGPEILMISQLLRVFRM